MTEEYIYSHRRLRAALTLARRELSKQPAAPRRGKLLKMLDEVLDEAKGASVAMGISRMPRPFQS